MLKSWLAAGVVAFALAGCASTAENVDPTDASVSLVFGYFDMHDAPSDLQWVSLKKYDSKRKDGEYYRMAARGGLFFHVAVEPGSYQVDKFGGMGGIAFLTRRPFEYNYGGKGRNATAMRIRTPGVYFLGAHRYVNHAGKGFFDADQFEMAPASAPGEKELLQRLVHELESDPELSAYKRQIEAAKKRLAEL